MLKKRFWIYGSIFIVLILALIFGPQIKENALNLSNIICSFWSKTSSDRHDIMIGIITEPINYVIGVLFVAVGNAIRKFCIKKRGNKDD